MNTAGSGKGTIGVAKMRVAAGHLTYVESADPLPPLFSEANSAGRGLGTMGETGCPY
jgi:hypothetical protein